MSSTTRWLLIAAAVSSFTVPLPASAELFTCSGPSGNIVIQDRPCLGTDTPNARSAARPVAPSSPVAHTPRVEHAAPTPEALPRNVSPVQQEGGLLGAAEGRDLFAPTEAGRELLADAGSTQARDTSLKGSFLNRLSIGAISGAALAALFGLFMLARAAARKIKMPGDKVPAATIAIGARSYEVTSRQAIGAGGALLLGGTALLTYFLFFRPNSVDYYLSNYPARMSRIQECGGVDLTKDQDCMNAMTAQRIFMRR